MTLSQNCRKYPPLHPRVRKGKEGLRVGGLVGEGRLHDAESKLQKIPSTSPSDKKRKKGVCFRGGGRQSQNYRKYPPLHPRVKRRGGLVSGVGLMGEGRFETTENTVPSTSSYEEERNGLGVGVG